VLGGRGIDIKRPHHNINLTGVKDYLMRMVRGLKHKLLWCIPIAERSSEISTPGTRRREREKNMSEEKNKEVELNEYDFSNGIVGNYAKQYVRVQISSSWSLMSLRFFPTPFRSQLNR
jgi:hypothetical protein